MNYEIIYSSRKSIGLKIKNGKLIIRSPYGVSRLELDRVVEKHIVWIKNAIERERAYSKLNDSDDPTQIRLLKNEAKIYFSQVCAHYANIMNVKYNRISITEAKTRFGSCSAKKNICFSYRLMYYPEQAREYVAVHELAHLKEMNHSPRFWSIVEKYMPDYKERKKLLKSK